MLMREVEVESYLVGLVEAAGGRCEKFVPLYRNGWPDRIVLLPGGVSIWVETKKPKGGRLDPLQIHAHKVLRALGQQVEVVWTKDEAISLLERYRSTGSAAAADTRA